MNEQRNLFTFFVVALAILAAWQYFIGGPRMQQEQARQQQTALLQKQAAPATPQVLPRAAALQESSGRTAIETPTLQGSINLTGGRFDDLSLRNYHDTPDPKSAQIELLSPRAAAHPYFAEFGWIADKAANQLVPDATTPWKQTQGDRLSPGHDIELGYDNGQGLQFTRRISVDSQYMFTVTDRVDNHSAAPVTLSPYGLVYRRNLPIAQHYWVVHEGFVGVLGGTLKDPTYADLDKNNDTQQFASKGGWLGITDKYWMAAVIPPQTSQFSGTYKAYDSNGSKAYQSDYLIAAQIVPPSGNATVVHHLFAGAKEVNVVNGYRDTLGIPLFDYSVDWGWFWMLTQPIFVALNYVYRFVGNFGISILIFTVFVKALFFPLANTSYRAMSKMKKLQPEMERLRERLKDDKAKQQQELMLLYQKEKVNPLAGCLPMLIQIPVFFSLYKVLLGTIDMRHAPFTGTWITDLSAPDPTNLFNLFGLIPYDPTQLPLVGHFLVLGAFPMLMGLTMWLQTNLNPPPADPMQQRIFGFMPLIFMFMMANFPVGLVIYWSWNNFLSIVQQVVIMKRTGTPVDFLDRLRGMGARIARGQGPEKPAGPPD